MVIKSVRNTGTGQSTEQNSNCVYFLSLTTEFLPNHRATTGVRATVGGNLMGDAALWKAYAIAAVPVFAAAAEDLIPNFSSNAMTSTPVEISK